MLIAFWTHALAAALFMALTLWQLRGGLRETAPRLVLAGLLLTALWAWLMAMGLGELSALAETVRNLMWIALLDRLSAGAAEDGKRQAGVRLVYAAVAAALGLQGISDLIVLAVPMGAEQESALAAGTILRVTATAGALVLVHNVYGQTEPSSRPAIRLATLALAMLWIYDLNLYTLAYLVPDSAGLLVDWRGAAVALTAPLFALSSRRDRSWRVKPSRAATFQSLSLLAICTYLAVMVLLARLLHGDGGDLVRLLAVTALAAMTLAAMVLIPSARARDWARVKLTKHLFEHRYDYRTEWLRFTDTVGRSGADAAPLGERVIKAFADILDAPAGMLLTADDGGAIELAAAWNWRGGSPPPTPSDTDVGFWDQLERDGLIVELDGHRSGWGSPRDLALPVPAWLVSDSSAWVAIPLPHDGRLIGIAVLAAPPHRRPLDWEDFDLLRTAGRQAASNLAESFGQQALMQAQRFEDFNRRFAFILHDVKNLVSQLSLLSRNAERHADNPEFRADMVATLKSSVGKMNDLLARLAPHGGQRPERAEPIPLRPILADAIAAKRRTHPVRLIGDGSLWVLANPVQLEQAVAHLLQNAIDASPSAEEVLVRAQGSGGQVSIDIIDRGCGMDSDFIRNRLFQPFASTKADGFGVGAFEARSLIAAMGGRLSVASRPAKGSQFTIHLPAAEDAAQPKRKIA